MRNVPKLDNILISFSKDVETEEQYHNTMERYERYNESKLIELFKQIQIQSSVKSNPYSLPYEYEITHTNYGESYINGAYEPERFFRKVVKELLDRHEYKIRFYVLMEVEDCLPMGKINFKFRYYVH